MNSPSSHIIRSLIFTSSLLLLVCATVFAQQQATDGATPLGLAPGAPAGSYPLSDFENVNLFNGSLNFSLPLVKIGGRGEAGYSLMLHIDYKWLVQKEPYDGQPPINIYTPMPGWWTDIGWAQIYSLGRVETRQGGSRDFVVGSGGCGYIHRLTLTRLTFIAPDGTEYELRDQATNGQPVLATCTAYNRGTVFVTADGTAATFISDTSISDYQYDNPANIPPSGYMLLKNGTRYRVDGGKVTWMRDRNGNKLTFNYDNYVRMTSVTDSLNRQVTINYDAGGGAYQEITYKGFGGATRSLKVYMAQLSTVLRSDFTLLTTGQMFPELNGAGSGSHNPQVVSAVELPNGKQYQFRYNSYAELTRVVLPTGGAIEYDYAAGLTDSSTGSGVVSGLAQKEIYRRVIERRVYPDGGSGSGFASRMTYSRPETSTTNAGYVTTDQYNASGTLLTRSIHYFYGSPRASLFKQPTEYPAWTDGREYKTETFAANGTTLLRRVENTFQQRATVSWWTGGAATAPPNDVRLAETVTTLADSNQISKQTFGYDDSVPFNNQNNVKEYDYGAGVVGPLRRETRTTYLTSASYTGTSVHLRNLPTQVSIYDGGGVERARTTYEYDNYPVDSNHAPLTNRPNISGFDATFTTGYPTRGNVTGTTRYLLSGGAVTGSISSYSQYDIAGNVTKIIDGRGNATELYYDDCFGAPNGEARTPSAPAELAGLSSYAFITSIKNPLNHRTYSQFDYYLGAPVDGEDANGVVASGTYSDSLDRPTQIRRAAGTSITNQTTFSYDDTNRIITTSSDRDTNNDNVLVSSVVYDQMGRTNETRQYIGGSSYIAVQSQYDALGRLYKTSNPFGTGETPVWTTTAFDALSRVISVTTPDTAAVGSSYSGNSVTVTDQAGKARKSVTDALGRLIEVYEDPAGLNYKTEYAYDVLDDLTTVTQGTQTRTFGYDSLKRLKSATNPESGTISYEYDNNANISQKTDARGVVTYFGYDALNRVNTILYRVNGQPDPNTGDVQYFYDNATNGKGRLWLTYKWDPKPSHTAVGLYDALGRVTQYYNLFGDGQGGWLPAYEINRSYDLAGNVKTQTYPSGHTVTYSYDAAGRTSSFGGNLGDGVTRTYASSFIYNARNQVTQELFGTQTPLYHKLQYNIRGQLWDIRVSTGADVNGSWNRGCLQYFYDGSFGYGSSGPDNNGNVLKANTYIPLDEQINGWAIHRQNYSYDALNRLGSVAEYFVSNTQAESQQSLQSYTYDRWGNRTINPASWGTGINTKQFTVNTSTNRLGVPAGQSGAMTYDSAGNLTTDSYSGYGSMTFDANNRIVAAQDSYAGWSYYTYNADGQRIKRKINNQETWQIYGIDGELLVEYPANGATSSPQKEYGYRDGQLLITAESSVAQNVSWTNAVGVSVNGNSLTKTAATGWGNAGATSAQSITTGDGYAELTVPDTTTHRFVGLSNGNSNSDYTDVDFAIHPVIGGTIFIYEGGVSRGTFGSYTAGDRLWVGVEGGVVKYRKNGALLYTSSITPTYPLLVDSALHGTGDTLSNVVISGAALNNAQSVSWQNVVGASVSGNTLTKTAATGWGNAGATSAQSITTGDGYVELTVPDTTTHRFVGLSNGNSNSDYTDVDFAIHPVIGGTIFIYEGGVSRGTFGSYMAGDKLRVAVEGGVVKYRKNGVLLYTSSITPTYPLLVDSALHGTGDTLSNVVINSGAGGAKVQWLVPDHLGTPRIILDQTGSFANVKRHDYLPFGEELPAGTGGRTPAMGYVAGDGVRQQFTQKERDTETGLDFFEARYYSSMQGRFTRPDPYNIILESQATAEINQYKAAAQIQGYLSQPQKWNRYAYVINNPLKYIDPTGEELWLTGSEEQREKAKNRIKSLVGKDAAKYLVFEEWYDKGVLVTKVKYSSQAFAKYEPGVTTRLADIIDSKDVLEYRIATAFRDKSGAHTTEYYGGAATVGKEESLNGHTQIFVHPNASAITQAAAGGASILGLSKSNDGKPLDFFDDIDDFHEFGHAYANIIDKVRVNSDQSNKRSLDFENVIRQRRGLPNRRVVH